MLYSRNLIVRVQPSFSERLAEVAKARGIGKSELTRRAIERELSKAPRRERPEARP